MTALQTVAFACYALVGLLYLAFGVVYLTTSKFMPYHAEAVGKQWEEIEPRTQVVLSGLMKLGGGGLVGFALAMACLLFVPFRQGEVWARWAIAVIGMVGALTAWNSLVLVKQKTQAKTPVWAANVGILLIVAGFALSWF
jgi:hypothetical protein